MFPDSWPLPGESILQGRYSQIEPFDKAAHALGLFACLCGAENDDLWTFIGNGPHETPKSLTTALEALISHNNDRPMIIRDRTSNAIEGIACYMRNRLAHGSTEIGHIIFSKKFQRSRPATEALFLMADHALTTLGYRRYEWKCDDRNDPSKMAALRLGFIYEGMFRQDRVIKGLNRDTCWYSIIDSEWPRLRSAYLAWLDDSNFDDQGLQRRRLQDFMD